MLTLDHALTLLAAGFSVIPIRGDGSKAPALESWERYQAEIATEACLHHWLADETLGIGVVCGPVSGGLHVVDIEFLDFYEQWAELVEQQQPGLMARLPVVKTPGKTADGGRHVYSRCEKIRRSAKLARISKDEAKERTGDPGRTTAIELKGDGGQVLTAGCPAHCHESGRLYEHVGGPALTETPLLTPEEFEVLIAAARALNRVAKDEVSGGGGASLAGDRPGDRFNREADWAGILEPHGWQVVGKGGPTTYFRRPGKTSGSLSATAGHCTNEASGSLLYVFTTNAEPFEGDRSYSKFAAHALLNFRGDWKAAAIDLKRQYAGQPEATTSDASPLPPRRKLFDDTEPFPRNIFPPTLERYMDEGSHAYRCPRDFFGATMLVAAAALMGASRVLQVTSDWHVYASIYLAIIAEPGSRKSSAISKVMTPLRWQQAQNQKDHKELMRGWKGTPEEGRGDKPALKRTYTTDPTMEKLVQILSETPRGVVMVKDEATALITGLNQYKEGGKGTDQQYLLSIWANESISVERKSNVDGMPVSVSRPFLSIIGGIQPDMLHMLADKQGRQDGFIDRFPFCYPETRPYPRWSWDEIDPGLVEYWKFVCGRLYALEMPFDSDEDRYRPIPIRMTDRAKAAWEEWYAEHEDEKTNANFFSVLKGHYAKLESYCLRFALAIHMLWAASCDDFTPDSAPPLDEFAIFRAAAVIHYFKSHARRAYGALDRNQEDRKAELLVRWIGKHGGKATSREIQMYRVAGVKKSTEAELWLKTLADRGEGVYCAKDRTFTLPDDPDDSTN